MALVEDFERRDQGDVSLSRCIVIVAVRISIQDMFSKSLQGDVWE